MRTGLVWVVLLVAGCSGGADRTSEAVIRDSAGVRVVEYERVAADRAVWTLPDSPHVALGAWDAEPAYQFYQVTGAFVLDDGRIVVANGGTSEIRWYDAAGTLLASAGREGDGPGEFQRLSGLARLPGDTVVAYDGTLRRFSLFDPAGAFVRSAPLEREGYPGMEYAVLSGAMADGTVLMAGRVLQLEGMTEGPIRAPMPVYRCAVDGSVLDAVGTFYGWEATVVIRDRGGVMAMSIAPQPFGLTTSVVPAGDGFVTGTARTYAFERHGPNGAVVTAVRVARPERPVTDDVIADYEEGQLADIEDENARRQRFEELADLEYPENRPAYGFPLLADRLGNVWVREIADEPDLPIAWSVFAPDGTYVGTATTPTGFGVMDIGADYVLGVGRDDLGVEFLQLYELRKGGGAESG